MVSKCQMDILRLVIELSKPRIGDSQSRLGVVRAHLTAHDVAKSARAPKNARVAETL